MAIGPMIPGLGVRYTSPAVRPSVSAGEDNRFRNLRQAATPRPDYLRVIAEQTAAAKKPAPQTQPVNVTGVAIPSYATNPRVIERANEINAGVVGGSPVELRTNPDGSIGSAPASEEPVVVGDGGDGSTAPAPVEEAPAEEAPAESEIDVQALYDSILGDILKGDFIGFEGDQASELRRLQNLRNQLYGDPEFGTTGSLQRQRDLDARARRRLAAQRAVAGMLQGGAYAGPQRGVGTLQQADQEYGIQEMLRPYREQTASDRLREFGLEYTPDSRVFNLFDFGNADDIMGGWATSTFAGREAAARAKRAALEQLTQQGLSL